MTTCGKRIFEVRCVCEDAFNQTYFHLVNVADPATITSCPLNIAGHTLVDKVVIDEISTEIVGIVNDPGDTQGLWRVAGKVLDVPGVTGVQNFDTVFPPYPTKVFNTTFQVRDENVGDSLTILGSPGTVAGVLTGTLSAGATTLNVSAGVNALVYLGYIMSVTNGSTTAQLGECVAKDDLAGTITTSLPSSTTFSAGAAVVYSILRVNSVWLTSAGDKSISHLVGGIVAAPNAVTRLMYNNTNGQAKKLYYYTTLFY